MRRILITLIIYLSVNKIICDLNQEITTVDLVLTNIHKEIWSTDESECLQDTVSILNNVKNHSLWASWIWNSNQNLVGIFYGSKYSLGNYDQCLDTHSIPGSIKTQYCLSKVKFGNNGIYIKDSSDEYINTKMDSGRVLNIAYWGSCLPASCSPWSVPKIMRAMYSADPVTSTTPQIIVEDCQVPGVKLQYSNWFYAFFMLMATFISLSVYATFFVETSSPSNDLIKSFSIKKNYLTLTKLSDNEITSLSFLKSVTAILAVLGHTILIKIGVGISNGVVIDEALLGTETALQKTIKHVDKLIEVFFVTSGLLLTKVLMKGDKIKSPLIALISIYFRLMGVFSIILLYVSSVMMHFGDGPQWPKLAGREAQATSENWLNSLLMINNYVNAQNISLLVAWFIPCNFQLAVLGTLLLCVWQKNKKIAKIVTAIVIMLALAIPAIDTYWKGLPGLVIHKDIEKIIDPRTNAVYLNTYIQSYARSGSFFIGMALGYIMTIYEPTKNRNVINRNQSISFFLLIAVAIQAIFTDLSPFTDNSAFTAAIHATTGRIPFALVIVALIIVVEYGDLPYFRSFTRRPIFSVLNKLGYGIYLVHTVVLFHTEYSRRNPTEFRSIYYEGCIEGAKTVIIAVTVSIGLWLFVEAPISNIVNHFTKSVLGSKKKNADKMEEVFNN